jgi:hypothetical protein
MVISLISLAHVEEDGLLLSAAFVAGIVPADSEPAVNGWR